jgi:hypothetical protein
MMVTDFDLKWGVRKRLEFIEFRLFWYERFNRPDLSEAFGISAQQATNDISIYQKIAPGNCSYDPKQKAYIRDAGFAPHLIAKSTDRYLLQLVAVASGWMEEKETWFENAPPVEVISLKRAPIDPMHLLTVLDAIRSKQQVRVDYQSLTGSPASTRIIAPHAITYNAGRWYVRAWNEEHNDFRDYHLNRIRAASDLSPCTVDYDLDYQWFQKINFVLSPNPRLDPDKRNAVEKEYEMVDGKLSVAIRLSHAFYLIDQYNLDIEEGILKPEKQQLILTNRDDVMSASKMARKMSQEALERNLSVNISKTKSKK